MAKQQLRWEPTHKDVTILSDETLAAVKKRLVSTGYEKHLTEADIPYLKGLADAGIAEANDLIAAIKQYKEIDLSIIDLEP